MLRDKRVVVMGLGLHGGAVGNIIWLYNQGAKVLVTDLKSRGELAPTLKKLEAYPDIEFVLGEHRKSDFTDADIVLRNPAVSRNSKYLDIARSNGASIEMDSSLFFAYCKSQDIIGITGSKGKSTTAHAIASLLDVVVVGMEGSSVLARLDDIDINTPVVFELSSWRLEALKDVKSLCRAAVVTSLYRDHLNTYDSFDEYIDTKKILIHNQSSDGAALLNYDDELVRALSSEVQGKLYWYSVGDTGDICIEDGIVTINVNNTKISLMPVSDFPVSSKHEIRNILPGILIAYLRGISQDDIAASVKRIKLLPHRLEFVREIDGVRYINDSASTMPDAAIAALKSFGSTPVVLILGGNDKELVFDGLVEELKLHTIRSIVFLPGSATDVMRSLLEDSDISMEDADDMQDAVLKARSVSQSGDTVLLSPAATSFRTFKHEFDRGDAFKGVVELF